MRISEARRLESFAGLYAGTPAREVLARVPPASSMAVRVVTSGERGQTLADFVSACLERWPAVRGLDISIWSLSATDTLRAWVERFGGPSAIRVITDSFLVERNSGAAWKRVIAILGASQVRVGATHMKAVRLVGTDVCLMSSGNLEGANRRQEFVEVVEDASWSAALGSWFDVAFQQVDPGLSPRPIADAALRRGFSLAASATIPVGDVRTSVLPPAASGAGAEPENPIGVGAGGEGVGEGVGDASMRAALEAAVMRVSARLAGIVDDQQLAALVRALVAARTALGEIAWSDHKLSLAILERFNDVIEVRSLPARREAAIDAVEAAVAEILGPLDVSEARAERHARAAAERRGEA